MREELERRLGIEFPFMRESGDEGESYTVSEVSSSYKDRNCERSFRYEWVHCDCGDGWYELIRELCRSISERYERDGKRADITVLQVKEKYGELRFYYEHGRTPHKADTLDFPAEGGMRSMQNDEAERQLREEIGEIVQQFEDRSSMICEECGSAGETRTDLPWMRTLCEECYAKLSERL